MLTKIILWDLDRDAFCWNFLFDIGSDCGLTSKRIFRAWSECVSTDIILSSEDPATF